MQFLKMLLNELLRFEAVGTLYKLTQILQIIKMLKLVEEVIKMDWYLHKFQSDHCDGERSSYGLPYHAAS